MGRGSLLPAKNGENELCDEGADGAMSPSEFLG